MSLGKVLSGVLIVGVGAVIGKGSEVITRTLIGRSFGPEELGLFAAMTATFQFFLTASLLELSAATMHFVRTFGDSGHQRAARLAVMACIAFSMTVAISVSGWLLLGGADHVGRFFGSDQLGRVAVWIALALPLAVLLHFYVYHLMATYRFRASTMWRDVVTKTGRLAVIALALLWGMGIDFVLAAYLMGFMIPGAMAAFLLRAELAPPAEGAADLPRRRVLGQVFRYGWPLALLGITNAFSARFDIFTVGHLLPKSDLGLFSAALLFSLVFTMMYETLNGVFIPFASALHGQGQRAQLQETWRTLVRAILYVVVPTAAILIGETETLLRQLFGSGFEGAAPAARILIVGVVIYGVQTCLAAVVIASGLTGRAVLLVLTDLAVTVAASLTLVPMFGLLGAAIANVLKLTTNTVAAILTVWRSIGISPVDGRLVRYLAVSTCLLGLVLWLLAQMLEGGLLRLTISVLCVYPISGFVAWYVVGVSAEERELLGRVAQRVAGKFRRKADATGQGAPAPSE